MSSKFIIEGGVIKLVKSTYSVISDKNVHGTLGTYSLEQALNLQKELAYAIDKAKEYQRVALQGKIANSQDSIKKIQEDIDEWQNQLKFFDAIN